MPRPEKTKRGRRLIKTLHFYTIRLPLIYILIPTGFIFEFLVTFPFLVLTALDRQKPSDRERKKQPH